MPISPLKHLTGYLLGATTTLVGHWVGDIALVAVVVRTTSQTHVSDEVGVVASTMVLGADPTRPPKLRPNYFLLCQQSIYVCYGRSSALGGNALRSKEYESSKVSV